MTARHIDPAQRGAALAHGLRELARHRGRDDRVLAALRDQQWPRNARRIDAVGAREAATGFDPRDVLVLRRAGDGEDAEHRAELQLLVARDAILMRETA